MVTVRHKIVHRGKAVTLKEHTMTEIEFLKCPSEWPKWPVLPLVHRSRHAHDERWVGFLIEEKAPPYKVYYGSIYRMSDEKPEVGEQFDTAEALLKDWRID